MNWVLLIVLQAFYFILPAGIANMFPVLLRKLPLSGSFPIHEKLFGKNKTRKWLISWRFWASMTLLIQSILASQWHFAEFALLDYSSISFVIYWFLFGVWALVWDLSESYVKRRMWIPPWWAFFPRDQLDRVVWSLIFVSLVFVLPLAHIWVLIILTPVLHGLINIVGYLVGLKDVWW